MMHEHSYTFINNQEDFWHKCLFGYWKKIHNYYSRPCTINSGCLIIHYTLYDTLHLFRFNGFEIITMFAFLNKFKSSSFPGKKVLILEGGGMRGIFLVGVLQAFTDRDYFPWKLISWGTSARVKHTTTRVRAATIITIKMYLDIVSSPFCFLKHSVSSLNLKKGSHRDIIIYGIYRSHTSLGPTPLNRPSWIFIPL